MKICRESLHTPVSHGNALVENEREDFVSFGSKRCLEEAQRKPSGNAGTEDPQGQSGKFLHYKN